MSLGKRILISFSIVIFLFFTVIVWIKPGILQSFLSGLSVFVALVITNYIAKKQNIKQKD